MGSKLFALAAFVAVAFLSTPAWSGALAVPVQKAGPSVLACCPDGSCCPDGPCCTAAKSVAAKSCCPLGICCPGGPCCDLAAAATCCPDSDCCTGSACCAASK